MPVKRTLDETRRENREGSGLGTTCACLVVKAHGGEIAVESGQAEGTTVTVRLRPGSRKRT
ncbi:MAG: HAMP domain-containing histidine kinase [Candidatus Glassbacteria bacterium]|nr:HAMP domain-containing histidine kinase [Candidatus Glassbacteria bacterium]